MNINVQTFKNSEVIPGEHTCDGKDTIPTIAITDVPKEAISLALIIDDPDATIGDTWNHCVVYNIPPETQEINKDNLETFMSGLNSWGNKWYSGPCPPKGSSPHRYIFKLYALNKALDFNEPPTSTKLTKMLENHSTKETSYLGVYSKK